MRALNASDFEPVETGAVRPKALARPLTASDFEPATPTPAEGGFLSQALHQIGRNLTDLVEHPISSALTMIPGEPEFVQAYQHGLTPEQRKQYVEPFGAGDPATLMRFGLYTDPKELAAARERVRQANKAALDRLQNSPLRRALWAALQPGAAPLQTAEYAVLGGLGGGLGEGIGEVLWPAAKGVLGAAGAGAALGVPAAMREPTAGKAVGDIATGGILGGTLGAAGRVYGALTKRVKVPESPKSPRIITLHDFEEVSPPEPSVEGVKPVAAEAAPSEVKAAQPEAPKPVAKSILTKPSRTLGKLSDELKAWVAPETRGPEAAGTARVIRSHAGENRAAALKEAFGVRPELKGNPISETVAGFRSYFRQRPPEERWDFVLKIQKGEIDKLPEPLQPLARIMRRGFEDSYKRINAIKEGALSYRENYFPQLWTDPEKAKALLASTPATAGGRSLEGLKSFKKMRKYPTIADGLAAGLEPRFDNPIDLYLAGIYEQRRFVMGQQILRALKDEGLVKFYRVGQAPAGWARIDDKIAVVRQYVPDEKGYIVRGYYMAPEPAARVINNFLSPSLRSRSAWFRGFDTIAAGINTFRVGFSAFHMTLESVNDMAVGTGRGVGQAIGALFTGDPERALRSFREIGGRGTPLGVYLDYSAGSKITHALFEPGSEGEQFERAVRNVIRAGGSFGPQQYDSMGRSFAEAADEVGLFSAPRWVTHQVSRPIMEYLVPRVKLGAFFRLSESALEDAEIRNGPLTPEEQTAILQRTWDHVDNIFGQLVRDNLFMTNGMKDALRLFISFPGWNIGSARLIGGMLRGAARIGTGGRLSGADRNSLEFAAGLLLTTALYHSLLQYAMTGQWPQNWRDVIIGARTGKLNPDGSPERVRLPSYLRDALGLSRHPWLTIKSKASPGIQVISDLLNNQNYWGDEIYNPTDPVYTKAKQIGEYLSQYATPFSIQAARHAQDPQAEILSLFGITPVPRWLTETPAEALLDQYSRQARGSATPEQAEISHERSQLRQMLRKGDIEGFRAAYAQARKRWLTKRGTLEVLRGATEPPGFEAFKHLTLEQALQVYALANTDERKQWTGPLLSKLTHADPVEIENNREAIKSALAAMRQDIAKMPASAAAAGAP
jgi:hypothetical protein